MVNISKHVFRTLMCNMMKLMCICGFGWYLGASSSSARDIGVSYTMLRPTYTHEAVQKLMSLGLLKHVISQNTDGLHRLSGIPREQMSELHGNAFHERCEKCGTKYERPFPARTHVAAGPEHLCVHCHCSHRTGRICERKVSAHLSAGKVFLSADIFQPLSQCMVISQIKQM